MKNQIQSSRITLENLNRLNDFVYFEVKRQNKHGKSFEFLKFSHTPEDVKRFPWTYKINQYGYRGKNWKFQKETVGFFGCSFTFGIGVEHSISDLVSKDLQVEAVNLGCPGSSVDNVAKLFSSFIRYHPLKVAVFTLPDVTRIFYPSYDSNNNEWLYSNLLANMKNERELEKVKKNAYKYLNENLLFSKLADTIDWIETTAKLNNITTFYSSWNDITNGMAEQLINYDQIIKYPNILDKARDLGHPGPQTHISWKTNIIEKIKDHV
jgi:hypothetical protein